MEKIHFVHCIFTKRYIPALRIWCWVRNALAHMVLTRSQSRAARSAAQAARYAARRRARYASGRLTPSQREARNSANAASMRQKIHSRPPHLVLGPRRRAMPRWSWVSQSNTLPVCAGTDGHFVPPRCACKCGGPAFAYMAVPVNAVRAALHHLTEASGLETESHVHSLVATFRDWLDEHHPVARAFVVLRTQEQRRADGIDGENDAPLPNGITISYTPVSVPGVSDSRCLVCTAGDDARN